MAKLPLSILDLAYNDPILNVFGDDWLLKLACPGRGFISSSPIDGRMTTSRTELGNSLE